MSLTTNTSIVSLKPIISGSGSTVTLTAAQSGSTCLFDRAAGIVFTLPVPVVGMYFDFVVKTTITSNAAKVITDAGSTFIQGVLLMARASDGSSLNVFANGSSNTYISSNGTTTGGVVGGWYRLTAISTTIWQVSGIIQTIGAQSTPVV